MEIVGLDHISIAVKSVEKSLAFYNDVLGMKVASWSEHEDQHVPQVSVQISPEATINLYVSDKKINPDMTHSINHICFKVKADSIDEVAHRLKSKGISIVNGPIERTGLPGDASAVFCKDPDGNLVELRVY